MLNLIRNRLVRRQTLSTASQPDLILAEAGVVVHHVLDRPLLGPAQGVNAGVDHQSAGSEQDCPQVTKPHQRILIETKLVAQRFTVETPALAVSKVDWKPRAV